MITTIKKEQVDILGNLIKEKYPKNQKLTSKEFNEKNKLENLFNKLNKYNLIYKVE